MNVSELYWGDSFHELPRQCLTGWPRTPEPAWGAPRITPYEGLVTAQLGRGLRVPWHPSACQAPGCGHALVWHRHKTRYKPCDAPARCACKAYQAMTGTPASDPRGAAPQGREAAP